MNYYSIPCDSENTVMFFRNLEQSVPSNDEDLFGYSGKTFQWLIQ